MPVSEYEMEGFRHMLAIEKGDLILVRDAVGATLRRRALTGVTRGGDFPVVWACPEREWAEAQEQSRDPEGIPWPAEDVALAET